MEVKKIYLGVNNNSGVQPCFNGGIRFYTLADLIKGHEDEFVKGANDIWDEGEEVLETLIKPDMKSKFDAASRLYEEFQRENEAIFMSNVAKNCKNIVKQFLELPTYTKSILPFVYDKKLSELKYLFDLAKRADVSGEMRIPGVTFPYFSEIPVYRLKMLEPIILSKNDMGLWNYSPSFILHLDKDYDDRQIEIMSKLARYKVNGMNLRTIAENPYINHDKTIEKAASLNELYGEKLREIEFLSNRNGENFLSADIQLPHRDDKPDYFNFERVFALLDEDVNPVNGKNKKSYIDRYVNDIYQNLEKRLCVFTQDDLNKAIAQVSHNIPEASELAILTVMQRLTQFADYSALKPLSAALKEAGVERMTSSGGINPFISYLQKTKGLFGLSDDMYSVSKAVFVTEDDLNDKSFNVLLRKAKDYDNLLFINLEGWSQGVNLLSDGKNLAECSEKVLKKTYKVLSKNPEYTFDDALDHVLNRSIESRLKDAGVNFKTIRIEDAATKSAVLKQMRPIMPTESLLKSTIESVALHFAHDNKSRFNKLCVKIAKYYDDNLLPLSKQSIIENLKQIHGKINEYLTEKNLSEDNLYYVLPEKTAEWYKSFDLINSMYAKLYNIPKKKFIRPTGVDEINAYPKDAVFVVLDDVVGTGSSMSEVVSYYNSAGRLDADKHILFCPVAATKGGLDYLGEIIYNSGRFGKDEIINLPQMTKDYQYTVEDFIGNGRNKLEKEVFGLKGHGVYGMSLSLPYMTPDNNSELASYITKFFIPDTNCIKTKTKLLPVIERETYFYNIFGCDEQHVLKDAKRVYTPKRKNPVIEYMKECWNKIFG